MECIVDAKIVLLPVNEYAADDDEFEDNLDVIQPGTIMGAETALAMSKILLERLLGRRELKMKILQKKLEETEQKLEVTLVKLNEVQESDKMREVLRRRCSVVLLVVYYYPGYWLGWEEVQGYGGRGWEGGGGGKNITIYCKTR